MTTPIKQNSPDEEHQEIPECCCQPCVDARNHAPYKANDPARQKCVYLAARYSRHPQMQAVRDELIPLGFRITSRWIEGGHEMSREGSTEAQQLERIRFAEEDWADLLAAETVINFTEEPRTTKTRGGRHVELGGALALGKRVIVIGYRENVFCCLPAVEFYETWQQCLNHLKDNSVLDGNGLWKIVDRGFQQNRVDICTEDGRLVAAGVNNLAAENTVSFHNATLPVPSDTERLESFSFEDHCAMMDAKHPGWKDAVGAVFMLPSAWGRVAIAREFWDAALASAAMGKQEADVSAPDLGEKDA